MVGPLGEFDSEVLAERTVLDLDAVGQHQRSGRRLAGVGRRRSATRSYISRAPMRRPPRPRTVSRSVLTHRRPRRSDCCGTSSESAKPRSTRSAAPRHSACSSSTSSSSPANGRSSAVRPRSAHSCARSSTCSAGRLLVRCSQAGELRGDHVHVAFEVLLGGDRLRGWLRRGSASLPPASVVRRRLPTSMLRSRPACDRSSRGLRLTRAASNRVRASRRSAAWRRASRRAVRARRCGRRRPWPAPR